jgi:hypothetical protein
LLDQIVEAGTRDEELHREVAHKEIQQQHADHPDSRTRFLLEAEIICGLEHPGIAPVFGLGHDEDGRPFSCAIRFVEVPVPGFGATTRNCRGPTRASRQRRR